MTILLIYGGTSSEYDVSIKSKENIEAILKGLGYNTKEIFITKEGNYLYQGELVSIIPKQGFFLNTNKIEFDVAFPILQKNSRKASTFQGGGCKAEK